MKVEQSTYRLGGISAGRLVYVYGYPERYYLVTNLGGSLMTLVDIVTGKVEEFMPDTRVIAVYDAKVVIGEDGPEATAKSLGSLAPQVNANQH